MLGCIISQLCLSVRFVDVISPPAQCSNTVFKMRNKRCEILVHPCFRARLYGRGKENTRTPNTVSIAQRRHCFHTMRYDDLDAPFPSRGAISIGPHDPVSHPIAVAVVEGKKSPDVISTGRLIRIRTVNTASLVNGTDPVGPSCTRTLSPPFS